jgi:hypothetical protein
MTPHDLGEGDFSLQNWQNARSPQFGDVDRLGKSAAIRQQVRHGRGSALLRSQNYHGRSRDRQSEPIGHVADALARAEKQRRKA